LFSQQNKTYWRNEMKLNVSRTTVAFTHEGGRAVASTAEQELKRAVMACMLWEDSFYESGVSIADRIAALVPKVSTEFAAACAAHARGDMNLRHVPLLIVREMARNDKHKAVVSKLLCDVIMRPDEITEFLAIYNKDKKQPLSAQVKKGLAMAFQKFNEYQLAKYNRKGAWGLRDALFLSHAKPTEKQVVSINGEVVDRVYKNGAGKVVRHDGLFKKLVDGTLETPDTWEVALSGGADKKETFERLMSEKKLGALAFLRNMRNMVESGVSRDLMREYAKTMNTDKVLPFRYISAARYAPDMEQVLEPLMFKGLESMERLKGKTILLVDVSGSMNGNVSQRSEMTRLDAAAALAMLLREICEDVDILTFESKVVKLPPRRGFALRDAIGRPRGGTELGGAVRAAEALGYDRLIVFTDEQSADYVPNPKGLGYMINVATYKNGVGSKSAWHKIDGFSEAIVSYIVELEKQ
jgi:60 kDa SS-A/Ro ribonucleoprotein